MKNYYNNLKVRTKILLGFCVVTLIMLLMVGLTLVGLRGTIASYENLIEGHYLRRDSRYDYRHSFESLQRHTNAMLVYAGINDTDSIEMSASYAHDAYRNALASLNDYNRLVLADDDIPLQEKNLRLETSGQVADILENYYTKVVISVYQYALYGDVAAGLQAIHQGQEISDRLAEVNEFLNGISDVWFAGIEENMNKTETRTYTTIVAVLITVILLTIAITILTASSINKSVTYPAQSMAGFLRQIQESGSLEFSEQTWKNAQKLSSGKDDISKALAAFLNMLKRFAYYGKCLERISSGDLSEKISAISDKDTCGVALIDMQKSLNLVFENLQTVSYQVAAGSKQIADGSQMLAQGSTEQAESVQKLSSSISDISEKTKNNADMAGRAAELGNTIKDSAEKGTRRMDEMMNAVRDINASSNNISKVIKSIDDIAFQTNILALNAAVEAARAGQHGKGFAVVAEEVRSLAAKSAEAAKNTEHLIADSIEKAELGSRIADDTAASLGEIVSGIGESSQLVNNIAESSKEQSIGIEQINIGIDKVAEVVQQNTAAAQQSAAASQEMTGQSTMLEESISHFKLKDSETAQLSPANPISQPQ